MCGGGGGGKGNPYNGLYGEAPPERGTVFMIQVHESRVGIAPVKVYERVEEWSFRSLKGPKRAKKCILWLSKSRENFLVL